MKRKSKNTVFYYALTLLRHVLGYLQLEANVYSRALSPDWFKYMDSVVTVGSASHIIISSSRASTKHGISRKRARGSDIEGNTNTNAASGLTMYWWRGGRISRQMFSWKFLPRSLVSKAARQGLLDSYTLLQLCLGLDSSFLSPFWVNLTVILK